MSLCRQNADGFGHRFDLALDRGDAIGERRIERCRPRRRDRSFELGDTCRELVERVWIDGGGYSSGTNAGTRTEGANRARREDVVDVAINHRLFVLGYTDLGALGSEFAVCTMPSLPVGGITEPTTTSAVVPLKFG